MLFEMAIGDAYGAGREFVDPTTVMANNDGQTYVGNPIHESMKPGAYTDDTQMSIAVAEWMLKKEPWNTVELADHFVHAFHRDQRPGYAGRFYDLLSKVEDGSDLVNSLVPMSDKAGGAMRAPVCGLMPSLEQAINLAMWQASVTHATFGGMGSAAAAAAMVWHSRRGVELGRLPMALNGTTGLSYDWSTPWVGPVGNNGIEAVHAAVTAISQSDGSLSDILVRSVAFTGDVDTVAAIAMAVASVNPDVVHNLPDSLTKNLEGGKYGWRFLKALDAKLMKAFPIPKGNQYGMVIDLFG